MTHDDERWHALDAAALQSWPLPNIAHDADKEARGRTLIVAGSREISGAARLSANAALRAGAGKVLIATVASAAPLLAIAIPEARVVGLPETADGGISMDGFAQLTPCAKDIDAVLIGPGLVNEDETIELVLRLLPLFGDTPVIVDALAMKAISQLHRFEGRVIVTPHAGEMAGLLGCSKDVVQQEPERFALQAARDWNATVALKGATTLIASPQGKGWRHESSHPGLATSGSGDVLAGVIVGLLARGAALDQAVAWGVVLHAMAGGALEHRFGRVGYLARELPQEIPSLMREVQR